MHCAYAYVVVVVVFFVFFNFIVPLISNNCLILLCRIYMTSSKDVLYLHGNGWVSPLVMNHFTLVRDISMADELWNIVQGCEIF